jgi:phosphonate transport system substrate-binding protein
LLLEPTPQDYFNLFLNFIPANSCHLRVAWVILKELLTIILKNLMRDKFLLGLGSLGFVCLAAMSAKTLNPLPLQAQAKNISQQETRVAQAPLNRVVVIFASRKDSVDLERKVKAVTDFLSQESGLTVEGVVADETAAIEALRANRADVAFLGGRGALKAEQLTGARMYLAEVRPDYSDGKTYKSVVVVKKNSPLKTLGNEKQTLAQLQGKKMAFASRTSGSGYIIPTSAFVGQGLVPNPDSYNKFFSEVFYGDGYSSALQALLRGQVDAAAVSEYALNPPWITKEEAQQLRVLWSIPGVPAHGIVFDDDVPAATRDKLIKAMLELNKPQNNAMFKTLYNSNRLVQVNHDQHLSTMRTALQRAKLEP